MDTLSQKTTNVNKVTATKEWVVVDATDQVLGRMATKVAKLLRGKYKPNFTPHVDCGDNVIIVNAEKIVLTGNKMTERVYLSYSGYPGGQKAQTPASIIAKKNGYDPKELCGSTSFENPLQSLHLRRWRAHASSSEPQDN